MDYANGKIYTIHSYHTDLYYIGSTTSTLTKRLYEHNSYYKQGKSCESSEIIKYGDAYIVLLEEFPCFNKDQLNKREIELIREHKNCINKKTDKPTYYSIHRYKSLEYNREYRETNREQIIERMRKYNNDNRERISKYNREYRQRKKEEEIQV
jgi:hypothetical protein